MTTNEDDSVPASSPATEDVTTKTKTSMNDADPVENVPTNNKGAAGVVVVCDGCGRSFPSKNALFRHLRANVSNCLSVEDHEAYLASTSRSEKIAVLYGYVPSSRESLRRPVDDPVTPSRGGGGLVDAVVRDGDDAAALVVEAVRGGGTVSRSFGHASRGDASVAQDRHVGASCEVLACRAAPLSRDDDDDDDGAAAEREWVRRVNAALRDRLRPDHDDRGVVRVHGRLPVPTKFHAEADATHRRIDCLLPADFLFHPDTGLQLRYGFDDLRRFRDAVPTFAPGHHHPPPSDGTTGKRYGRPRENMLRYLHAIKKIMQRFTTHIEKLDETDDAAVRQKGFHVAKRSKAKKAHQSRERRNQRTRRRTKDDENDDKETKGNDPPREDEENLRTNTPDHEPRKQERVTTTNENGRSSATNGSDHREPKSDNDNAANVDGTETKTKKTKKARTKNAHVLRRKRYHNFTPRAVAHDFLSFRRLDRFFHSSTVRFEEDGRPFLVLSLTGDQFLLGQVRGVLGLFLAVARGSIDEEVLEAVFDDDWTEPLPAPPAPARGLYVAGASYTTWEGRVGRVLSPRRLGAGAVRPPRRGWGDETTLADVARWTTEEVHRRVAAAWGAADDDATGSCAAVAEWEARVLAPWAAATRERLRERRAARTTDVDVAAPPVDRTVPGAYAEVLRCLRAVDRDGLWPSTTLKRRLVIADDDGDEKTEDLSARLARAKARVGARVPAYAGRSGGGGASGSFSVGIMPGRGCGQPAGNRAFPELTRAAFRLERTLRPDREPSSTIAINRNARFRPHTDNGAGAGQSRSLIVGLGDYSGGELVVEGERMDIRYRPVEFDGWTQRHWTLPFRGERYSLVWFTPKGCEGARGIDLVLNDDDDENENDENENERG